MKTIQEQIKEKIIAKEAAMSANNFKIFSELCQDIRELERELNKKEYE